MHKMFSALLAGTFLGFAPLSAFADEAEMKAQVAEISAGLVERLPMDQKIVLKALSPEESGLPEDFLRKLTNDLEAALLVASDFEINLANRLSTEELWSEATEFGDADFEELYAASQANIMLMLTPRATGAGLEISVTAYQLLGDDAGQVIASSGSVLLSIDMESSLGIDVNSFNDQMSQVLQEIEKVGQIGGLITSPSTYPELYHNARIFQQRGEIDLALSNYEAAVKISPFPFVDPVEDLVGLAQVIYGTGSKSYVEVRLKEILSDELFQYALWLAAPRETQLSVDDLADQSELFLPLIVVWLEQNLLDLRNTVQKSFDDGAPDFNSLFLLLEGSRAYLRSLEEGELQAFYIDKLRARTALSASDLRTVIEDFSMTSVARFETDYQIGTGFKYIDAVCGDDVEMCDFNESPLGIPSQDMDLAGIPLEIFKIEEISEFEKIDYTNIDWKAIFPIVSKELRDELKEINKPIFEDYARHLGPCGFVLDNEPRYYDQIWLIGNEQSLNFGGIGLVISNSETLPIISKVYPGSPAEIAGLSVGDSIFSINGDLVNFEDIDVKINALINTDVTFVIFSDSRVGSFEIILKPDESLYITISDPDVMSNVTKGLSSTSTQDQNLKTLEFFSRSIPMRASGQTFNSELIIAPYDALLLADFCIDILSQAATRNEDRRGRSEWSFETSDRVIAEFGVAIHPNVSRLEHDLTSRNYGNVTPNFPNWSVELDNYNRAAQEAGLYKMIGLQGLLITDHVDIQKPVLLLYTLEEYIGSGNYNNILGAIDITLDGTTISNDGIPFNPSWRDSPFNEDMSSIDVISNNWFYAPGVIQGSVGLTPNFIGVFYTDLRGRQHLNENVIPSNFYIDSKSVGAPPGILFSEECQQLIYENDEYDPKFFYTDLSCPDIIQQLGEFIYPEINGSSFSLPRSSEFTRFRRAHFHDMLDVKYSVSSSSDGTSNSANDSYVVSQQTAEPVWTVYQSLLDPVHLGDEEIKNWTPLLGECLQIEFPSMRAGGKVGLTYEPYGLESAYVSLPWGESFILPTQEILSGRRPNYWGEQVGVSFDIFDDVGPAKAAICSNFLDPSDLDDLMLRNVQTWAFQ